MREIEFRSWNKYHEKMYRVLLIDFEHSIIHCLHEDGKSTHTFGFIDIELLQFTGLRDKSGVKIYECDLVKWGENIETVSFADGYFQTETSMVDSCMEVIGNLHQNPELLGESGE